MGRNTNAFKKYREGNITAAFGTDLFTEGIVAVPGILLKCYRRMGLTEGEVMLLMHLLRLRQEGELFPSEKQLGEYLSGGAEQAAKELASLARKQVLAVTQYYHEGRGAVVQGYDLEPLFEKLSELWAFSKLQEIEKAQQMLQKQEEGPTDPELADLYRLFASEFGRPLSPLEVEQIRRWQSESGAVLVQEALRRAVLLGKHNFKYIDSILLEWQKNNIRTLEEVDAYERSFQERRKKGTRQGRAREKAILRSLYL
ncbi:MAG: DnaD domain protein [Bacillota bacterium]